MSANRRVPAERIDEIVLANGEKILAAVEKARTAKSVLPRTVDLSPEEIKALFDEIIAEVYPTFAPYGAPYPVLRIRKMKSRWGSCSPSRGIITLNSLLAAYPRRLIEYVAVHEFCHFLVPNHSPAFYAQLTRALPDWRRRKAELNAGSVSTEELSDEEENF